MLNKILLRKIKFPLSLRGAKQACPSESRGSNLKGFSLIELMVAVVILAMAIFGIFQAYSVGFMGMADARDRTVATNYAQEAMENIKNMLFEEIISANSPSTQIGVTKFWRGVQIDPNIEGSPNLIKVTVNVLWKNRNEKYLNIETSMLVNKIEFFAGAASRILLYVYPYNVIFPVNDSAELTAVVKDAKGNTITNWDKAITFTITIGADLGYLETVGQTIVTKSPTKGYATVKFYSTAAGLGAAEKGQVFITAKVLAASELGYDTAEIILTWGAVKIALIPAQTSIKTNGNTTITAYLKDAEDKNVTNAEAEITFTITGEGTLTAPLTKLTVGGQISIALTASNTPGIATITASASNLFSDSVDIYVTGPPTSIYVEVSPNSIYLNGTAEVTVTLKDINGVTASAEELVNINLALTGDSIGKGNFNPATISIITESSSGNSTFTPTATGNATVQASDSAGKLTTGVDEINIVESIIADHIEVSASPSSIKVGGDLISTITAVIKNSENITVFNYNQTITFTTTKGKFSNGLTSITLISTDANYKNGVVIAVLNAITETQPGIATITVTSDSLTPGSAEVGFYVEADHINLSSVPNSVNLFGKVTDTCNIVATIKDNAGNTVENYVGTVTFSILPESTSDAQFVTSGSTIVTVSNGQASIDLRSKCNTGTVVVKATSTLGDGEIISEPNLEVIVNEGGTRNIELVTGSVGLPGNQRVVGFSILTSGGDLRIYNLKITSGTTAKLTEIKIDEVTVYIGSSNDNIIVDINPTLLSLGEHHIYFTYSAKVDNKNFNIIFNADPDCGYLTPIVFLTPK
jgi:prepilin-type N-terminal cleavage/methylation domain-containing protein